jgi:hypothetical protein
VVCRLEDQPLTFRDPPPATFAIRPRRYCVGLAGCSTITVNTKLVRLKRIWEAGVTIYAAVLTVTLS